MELFSKKYRFRFMVAIIMNMARQLSGTNFLTFFSTKLFNSISGNGQEMTIVIGATNIVGGIIGIFTIRRLGRRFNLITGVIAQIIGFSLLIIGYEYKIGILSIISVLSYIIGYAISLGGTMPIFAAEIVPAAGVGIGGSLQWLVASILGKVSPIITDKYGNVVMIAFFIIMLVLSLFFINYACIETSGLSKEDIDVIYEGKVTADGKSHHFNPLKFTSS